MTRGIWKGPFVHPSLLKKIDKLKKEVGEWHKTYVKMHGVAYRRLNTHMISLFGWNISLWRDDKGGKSS